jgi:hypothetical protein
MIIEQRVLLSQARSRCAIGEPPLEGMVSHAVTQRSSRAAV